MSEALRVTVAAIGGCFAAVNLYLLYKRRVSQRLFLFWGVVVILSLLIALFPIIFNDVAFALGVSYPPALLFLLVILGLMTVTINQSIQITMLRRKVQGMGQLLALLQKQVSELQVPASSQCQVTDERVREALAEQ